MKLIDKFRNEHIQTFLLWFSMFVLGAVADGFGFLNWILNVTGILLQIGAMVFLVIDFVILFDSGLLPSRKSVIINLLVIFVCLLLISICWNLQMTTFLITTSLFMLLNIIMAIIGMYRMTRVYIDIVETEKKEKAIVNPNGRIVDFFSNIIENFW